ncbi:MAG: S-layer protein [Candidatus Micrarchaeota archaeon]
MRKLNIKKLAAIAAGTVLVGAAFATAAFTDLTKSDIVSATGTPVVSVVVGSNAAVSDVVWAGNIAAKVAQLSTKTTSVTQGTEGSAGTPTDLTVNVNVGGTQTFSGGVREYNNANLNSVTSGVEYYESIGSTYFPQFFNGTVNRIIDGNAATSMTVIETLGIKADGKMDTTSNIKDLVATINSSDMNYNVSLSPGVPYPFTDTGSDDYIPIHFLGKSYVVDSINSSGSDVVLVEDGADHIYTSGDTFTALGRDGKTYTIRFDGGSLVSGVNVAGVSLLDDQGVVVKSDQFSGGTDIIFRNNGVEILATRIRLTAVGSTTQNNSTIYTFKTVVGTSRVEIQSGREVPYDPNSNGSNIPWVASFTTSAGTVTGITIKNSSNYNFTTSSPLWSAQALYPGTHPTQFEFFHGTGLDQLGTFEFKGFYDAGVQKTKVEFLKGAAAGTTGDTYGTIHYFDVSGTEHWIPMAIKLQATSSTGTVLNFDGTSTQAYWTSSESDINKFAVENDSASIPMITTDYNVSVLANDVNWDSSAIVVLKGKNGTQYKYLARKSTTLSSQLWLLLVGGSQNSGDTTNYSGYIDSLQYSAGDLFLLGTAVNDVNILLNQAQQGYIEISDANTGPADSNRTHRPYYWPDIYDFNGNQPGSTTNIYRTAVFKVAERLGTTSTTIPTGGPNAANAQAFILWDTENGSQGTIDTQAIGNGGKQNWAGTLTGAPASLTTLNTAVMYIESDQNLVNFSEYNGDPGQSSGNYKKAYTVNGSKIELANRDVTMTLPDRQMKSYFLVKSNEVTTSTSGGEDSNDLSDGDTFTTTGGTSVTITGINGTCSAGSGACVPASYEAIMPVGQLVYTDQSPPSGNYIIVGGYLANNLAKNLEVDGTLTLEDKLQTSGQTVAQKLESGNIVVAGYTATDTMNAAKELITALTGLLQ